VASQDLLGQAWLHASGDDGVLDESRRRERALWVHQPEPLPADRRRPPPSERMGACHMPRRHFVAVAVGWGALVTALLGVVLALRWLG
jgi:hypothetical protein